MRLLQHDSGRGPARARSAARRSHPVPHPHRMRGRQRRLRLRLAVLRHQPQRPISRLLLRRLPQRLYGHWREGLRGDRRMRGGPLLPRRPVHQPPPRRGARLLPLPARVPGKRGGVRGLQVSGRHRGLGCRVQLCRAALEGDPALCARAGTDPGVPRNSRLRDFMGDHIPRLPRRALRSHSRREPRQHPLPLPAPALAAVGRLLHSARAGVPGPGGVPVERVFVQRPPG
mmetsp:Transcript_35707/g.112696  ORF Transcript_35707/g.112696 Transcript_35707/m.112696 type:complete len:229 (-) Transcript_35707:4606-5292(-)